MPRSSAAVVEKQFTKGKITEFTGLNFPEDAVTEDDNCIFTKTGLVYRRPGIDYELNYTTETIDRANSAISSFYWKNVAGDGSVDLYVTQVGDTIHFWDVSDPDKAETVSTNKLATTITLTDYLPSGSPNTSLIEEIECQYTFGYGYLFIFHPYLDPIYVTYDTGTITGTGITVKTRDTSGFAEGTPDDFRPTTLTDQHKYNLQNQGWVDSPDWTSSSVSPNTIGLGAKTFTVEAGLSAAGGDHITVYLNFRGSAVAAMSGTVFSYVGTTLVLTITSLSFTPVGTFSDWSISSGSSGYINTFFSDVSLYPSNADQWWRFKDSTDLYNPATTAGNVVLGSGPAPKGKYILEEFNKQKSIVSGISGITNTTVYTRPSTGCWMSGRIWYTGVNSSGLNNNIYFSQIIEDKSQFGYCYQRQDPTAEQFSDLLPSDGGVIQISGAETIHKIIPYKNTLLVFASNGIWNVSGSQGVGFTALDYSIHKLEDAVPTLSHTSFVDVQGTPMWWNTEGIYTLSIKEQNIKVDSLTHTTIATFFQEIPAISRKFARGYYNKNDYIVQWLYRDTEASSVEETYEFTNMLNLNTITGAFYSWSISDGNPNIASIVVLDSNGNLSTENTVIEPVFKYFTSNDNLFTFSEINNTDYLDWFKEDNTGINYSSYFITGYKVYGDAQRKFQTNYIYVYSDGTEDTSYGIQGIWDYANSSSTGQFSSISRSVLTDQGRNYIKRRYKIRGHGIACQLKFTSVEGEPFRLIGWSIWQTGNQGV